MISGISAEAIIVRSGAQLYLQLMGVPDHDQRACCC